MARVRTEGRQQVEEEVQQSRVRVEFRIGPRTGKVYGPDSPQDGPLRRRGYLAASGVLPEQWVGYWMRHMSSQPVPSDLSAVYLYVQPLVRLEEGMPEPEWDCPWSSQPGESQKIVHED